MKCEKCQDSGIIDLDKAGIFSQFCDCEIGKQLLEKKRAIYGIPEEMDDSGTGQPDSVIGSADTSEPKQPKKRKAKKKARKRTH